MKQRSLTDKIAIAAVVLLGAMIFVPILIVMPYMAAGWFGVLGFNAVFAVVVLGSWGLTVLFPSNLQQLERDAYDSCIEAFNKAKIG